VSKAPASDRLHRRAPTLSTLARAESSLQRRGQAPPAHEAAVLLRPRPATLSGAETEPPLRGIQHPATVSRMLIVPL